VRHQLLATSYRLLATGCWLLAAGCWLRNDFLIEGLLNYD
jgi:hypothetical protein